MVGPGCWKWLIKGKLYKIISSLILVHVSASWLTTMWETVAIASTVRERTPYYDRTGLLYQVPSLTMMDWIILKSKSQNQPFSPETGFVSYSAILTRKVHNTWTNICSRFYFWVVLNSGMLLNHGGVKDEGRSILASFQCCLLLLPKLRPIN